MQAPRLRAFALGAVVAVAAGLLPLSGAGAAPSVPPPVPDPAPWLARRPLNIAHAGGDLEAPHETMYAYEEAVAGGADVLEMDLRLSKDRQLMVAHDDTVDRTTNATGPLNGYTAAELQALDNAYWFVPNCWSCHDRPAAEYALRGIRTGATPVPAGHTRDDFGVPTFRQVLDRFPNRLLDIEIKDGPDGMAAAEQLAAVLAGSSRATRVVVVSFDDAILQHFHDLAPEVPTSPGLGETTNWFLGAHGDLPGRVSVQVPPVYSGLEVVTRQFVDDAHAAHMAVWVWFNGNDDDVASEWNRLLDLGVDGLITGKPKQLQVVLDARESVFRTPLEIGRELRWHHGHADVSVGCPSLAADRCYALLGIRAGGTIVGGAVVDLRPGTRARLRIGPDHLPWPHLARRGLVAQYWGTDDIGSTTVPIRLSHHH